MIASDGAGILTRIRFEYSRIFGDVATFASDTDTGYTGNRDHAYDLNGNCTTDSASAPGTSKTATYSANTNRIATLNGAAVTLDAAGQITKDGLNSYTWDGAGRLKTVSRGGPLRSKP